MISSKFIKATEQYGTYEKPVNAPLIRKSFALAKVPDKAELTMTCTGFYRVWVNGKEITSSRLAPCITNPDQIIFYDHYNIAELLTAGKNCISFMLGNGISNCIGGFVWSFEQALFRSAPKLAVHVEVGCGDETLANFEADESFRHAPSPIYFDDLRSGEFYDANLEIPGWNLPDFDDSTWASVIPTDPARGKAEMNATDKIVITKELKAERIFPGRVELDMEGKKLFHPFVYNFSKNNFYKPEENETGYVFAFSENTACVPKLTVKGKKGQKIVIQAAEFCDKDGNVCFENHQMYYPLGFCQRDIYICKGDGIEEYVPSFTYHGARFFLVMGLEKDQINDSTVTMLVQNSDIAERGGFSCSDPIANALQRNARISSLANLVYFPTDCPHREKNGWTGDAAMSAEHMIQNLTVENSFKQWLRMISAAQREDGAIPGIVPTAGWGFDWGNGPVWDQVMVELPYVAYLYRGDTELFKVASNMIVKYLNYISVRRKPDGTICIGLGDWCNAQRTAGGNHLCPTEVSDTATCINICRKAKFLFDACGMKAQSAFADALGKEFTDAFRARFIDFDSMTVLGSCQTAQAIGLYYDIFEASEKPEAYRRLVEFVHMDDDRFNGGMIGARILFRTLAAHGDAELAYKMITSTKPHAHGIWVSDFGLASTPETFEATVDGTATSLNHHFMDDYSGFFIAHIAGLVVNPYKNNPAFVRIAPNFVGTLTYAESYYDTVSGKVRVRWEKKGDEITLITTADGNNPGEVVLPKGYVFTLRNGGESTFIADRRLDALHGGTVTYTVKKK